MNGSEKGGNKRRARGPAEGQRRGPPPKPGKKPPEREEAEFAPRPRRQGPPQAREAGKPDSRRERNDRKKRKQERAVALAGETLFGKAESTKAPVGQRPKWTPARPSQEPLPVSDCPICGKPVKDLAMAFTDRSGSPDKPGVPVHFDCILEKIAAQEKREPGDTVCYIGGGRFGIMYWQNPQNAKSFHIKKIIEWEDRERRADWRGLIADRYSMT